MTIRIAPQTLSSEAASPGAKDRGPEQLASLRKRNFGPTANPPPPPMQWAVGEPSERQGYGEKPSLRQGLFSGERKRSIES